MTTLRICFVGDSITNGTTDAAMLGWPGRLCVAAHAAGHDVTHYNLGVRAETSHEILRRWRGECEARLPALADGRLVLAFGINDSADQDGVGLRVPMPRSLDHARAIIGAAKAWKPTLWLGPVPVARNGARLNPLPGIAYGFDNARLAAYNAAYGALAAELSVPYLDLFKPLAGDDRWFAQMAKGDGVHPVADGYATIAEAVGRWSAWRAWFA